MEQRSRRRDGTYVRGAYNNSVVSPPRPADIGDLIKRLRNHWQLHGRQADSWSGRPGGSLLSQRPIRRRSTVLRVRELPAKARSTNSCATRSRSIDRAERMGPMRVERSMEVRVDCMALLGS